MIEAPVIEITHRIVKIDSLDYLKGFDGKREMFLHFWVRLDDNYYKPFLLDEHIDFFWLKKAVEDGMVFVSDERYKEKLKL